MYFSTSLIGFERGASFAVLSTGKLASSFSSWKLIILMHLFSSFYNAAKKASDFKAIPEYTKSSLPRLPFRTQYSTHSAPQQSTSINETVESKFYEYNFLEKAKSKIASVNFNSRQSLYTSRFLTFNDKRNKNLFYNCNA